MTQSGPFVLVLWLACFDLILADFSPAKARRSCDA
jgi:hypothetical protein